MEPDRSTPKKPESLITQVRLDLAAFVRQVRRKAGLSRLEVAVRMGYRNLAKGTFRVAQWEKGEDMLRGDRISALARALGIEESSLRVFCNRETAAKQVVQQERNDRIEANLEALQAQLTTLVENVDRLMGRIDDICATPDWRDVLVRCANYSVAFIGGGSFTLGGLLTCWAKGILTIPCPCCGGPQRVFQLGGSPFSGSHRITGFCPTSREVHSRRLPENILFVDFALAAIREQAAFAAQRRNPLALEDVILALGGNLHIQL